MTGNDPILHIQLLDQKRELPLTDECCDCGQATNDILDVTVRYITRADAWLDSAPPLLLYLIPRFIKYAIIQNNLNSGAEGEDRAVGFPVRMCKSCIEALPRAKTKWIPLICREPLYRNLFERYPRAVVVSGFKRSNMRPMSSVY